MAEAGCSQCHVLEGEGNFQSLLRLLKPDGQGRLDTNVLAFDFDQTLKVSQVDEHGRKGPVVRGGHPSKEFLTNAGLRGAKMCVITAAAASADNVRTIATEIGVIGLEREFHVWTFNPEKALEGIRAWGANADLDDAHLTAKLAFLLSLATKRTPADLARIVLSSAQVTESGAVTFRLIKEGMMSALQKVVAKSDDIFVCPCDCWIHYIERRKQVAAHVAARDRLFVFPDGVDETQEEPGAKEIVLSVRTMLAELGYDCLDIDRAVNTAEVLDVKGVRLAQFGNVIACRYNKPEALAYFVENHAPGCTNVIFVDDNSDNVWNVHHFFESERRAFDVHSVWFSPPPGGRDEPHDEEIRQHLVALATVQASS